MLQKKEKAAESSAAFSQILSLFLRQASAEFLNSCAGFS